MNTAARVGLAASLCFLVASFPAIAQKAVPADSIAIGVVNPENGDAVLYTDLSAQDRSLNRIQVTIKNDKATAFAFPDKQCVATISMGNFLSDSELKGATLDDKSASSWKLVVDKGKFSIYAIGDKTLASGESFIVTFSGVLIDTAEFAGASVNTTVSVQSTFPDKKVYRASTTFKLLKKSERPIDLHKIIIFEASKQIEDQVLEKENFIECGASAALPNRLCLSMGYFYKTPGQPDIVFPDGTTIKIDIPFYKEGDDSVPVQQALTTAEYLNKASVTCSGPFEPAEHPSTGVWIFRKREKGDLVFRQGDKLTFLIDNLISQLPAGPTCQILATVQTPVNSGTPFRVPVIRKEIVPQILKFEISGAKKEGDQYAVAYGAETKIDLELYGDTRWNIKYIDCTDEASAMKKKPIDILGIDTPLWPLTRGSITLRLPRGRHYFLVESTSTYRRRPSSSPETKWKTIYRVNVEAEPATMVFGSRMYSFDTYVLEGIRENAPNLLEKPYSAGQLALRASCSIDPVDETRNNFKKFTVSLPLSGGKTFQLPEDQALVEKNIKLEITKDYRLDISAVSTFMRTKTGVLNPRMNLQPVPDEQRVFGAAKLRLTLVNPGFPKDRPAMESSSLSITVLNDPFTARSEEVVLDKKPIALIFGPAVLVDIKNIIERKFR